MKRKSILFGLVLAVFVGSFGISSAQTNANYQNKQLIEIGPDNVGGRVRSLIATTENDNMVLYAGGVAGGLFKSTSPRFSNTIGMWEYIPYKDADGKEITLPITDMVQTPDGKLYIATGEGFFEHGVTNVTMAPKGYGIFVYDPSNGSFQQMNATDPASHSEFSYINRLGFMAKDSCIYLYAGTNEGLYRWKIEENANGQQLPAATLVRAGAVQDIAINRQQNIAFFTSGREIYKVGNVTSQSAATLVADANTKFGTYASRIELDVNYSSNQLYIYAQVADEDGLLNGVYLTHDQQNWTKLTTSTITPFTTENPGHLSNAIAIDPYNHNRIIIGGATLWVGEGFMANSNYMWNKVSYSEYELNYGDYMSAVFYNSMFVHSGIHAIVPYIVDSANYYVEYFIVTDGGVYKTSSEFVSFSAMNKGLNAVQFNSIAVTPDGSLLGGAVNNAVTFIESRMDHNGGMYDSAWYDNAPTRMNHIANVLWQGSGADVAASMFQQVQPQSRRGIFVSSNGGQFGRSYKDYNDFTNTQTWTMGSHFVSYAMASGPEQPKYVLWETTNNTNWNDSITFTIDTLGEIRRGNETVPLSGDFEIQAGDVVMVPSLAHFSYPIYYTFPTGFVAKENMTHKIANPIANRLFITGFDGRGRAHVMMNCTPTDFRCVYDTAAADMSQMNWITVYKNNHGYRIDNIAVSNDADAIFVNVYDTASNTSAIYRVRGLSKSDVNYFNTMNLELSFENEEVNNVRTTIYDTIKNGSEFRFDRPITSMSYDKREGRDVLIITFGSFEGETANMAIVNNASSDNYTFRMTPVAKDDFTANDPVYSALVEITTGDVFVGTEKGVYKSTASNLYAGNATWEEYGSFRGVPVKSIIQQTSCLPTQHFDMHTGINTETYVFAKTKYPYAIYFGTYGRGIFMDSSYVTDHENEIVDRDFWTGITNVSRGENSVRVYPNPAADHATLDITLTNDANTIVKIYDIGGRVVYSQNLGRRAAGNYTHKIDCSNFMRGMYLVNIVTGQQTATSKLIVK